MTAGSAGVEDVIIIIIIMTILIIFPHPDPIRWP